MFTDAEVFSLCMLTEDGILVTASGLLQPGPFKLAFLGLYRSLAGGAVRAGRWCSAARIPNRQTLFIDLEDAIAAGCEALGAAPLPGVSHRDHDLSGSCGNHAKGAVAIGGRTSVVLRHRALMEALAAALAPYLASSAQSTIAHVAHMFLHPMTVDAASTALSRRRLAVPSQGGGSACHSIKPAEGEEDASLEARFGIWRAVSSTKVDGYFGVMVAVHFLIICFLPAYNMAQRAPYTWPAFAPCLLPCLAIAFRKRWYTRWREPILMVLLYWLLYVCMRNVAPTFIATVPMEKLTTPIWLMRITLGEYLAFIPLGWRVRLRLLIPLQGLV
ncbi:hypothetical protein WJX72_008442 [[Myrmecia] bisecta]|uniref:Uncharacterized protein n=1 Tax=[Myrmecia] bisecta TaxID=41462 RepID=A0AAW1QRW3_9CHLO